MENALFAAVASALTLVIREVFAGLSALRDKDAKKERAEKEEYQARMDTYCDRLKKDNDALHEMLLGTVHKNIST